MSVKDYAQARAQGTARSAQDSSKVKAALKRTKYRDNQRWSFGFRFFREIPNFGLDSDLIDKKWPLSLMYRMRDLSTETLMSVMEKTVERRGTLRFHEIDWAHQNVPIRREDLDWIAYDYLNNEAEFPLMQLALSRADGRIVGFFDEDNVYQVVLLDPLHNAQPTKYHDYKVRLCQPLGCEVTAIKHAARKAVELIQAKPCGCASDIANALDWTKSRSALAVIMPLEDHESSVIEDADHLISDLGLAKSYREIFEAGIYALLAKED